MTLGETAPPEQPDFHRVKAGQQQTWKAGDYQEIGTRIVLPSEILVEAMGIRSSHKVLDVASGTGNAALAAARRFCDITSTDFVPEMLERGRIRAKAEGLSIIFEEADAENLPYPEDTFDVVLSVFGVMFAPDHTRAAREILRVCRPGGRIGLVSWTPEGLNGRQSQTIARYAPPAPGILPPVLWGTESHIQGLFGEGACDMTFHHRHVTYCYPSPEFQLNFLRTHFGPYITAFAGLDEERQAGLVAEMIANINEFNEADDGTVLFRAAYLEAIVEKA